MIELSKLGRVSYTLCKPNKQLEAKIVTEVTKHVGTEQGTQNLKSPYYIDTRTDKKTGEKFTTISLVPDEGSHILLNSKIERINPDMQGERVSSPYCYIYPLSFMKFIKFLNEGKDWLLNPEMESIFTKDPAGKTVGISNQNIAAHVYMRFGYALTMKPTVVTQDDGMTFQGVLLMTDKGVLAALTGEEFMYFYRVMKDTCDHFEAYCRELYTLGMTLINSINSSGGQNG
jgi:hypothetical protein